MTYDFTEQLNSGKKGEWVMDKYHAPFYRIDKVGRAVELAEGYDRIFTSRKEKRYRVEIKTDYLSQKYGNIIIETVSVDTHNIPGWALTSQCDVLIFYLWHLHEVLYYWMPVIKEQVPAWKLRYGETAIIPNDGYNTIGIKLPLDTAREYTFAIRSTIDPYWMKENHKTWAGCDG